MHYCIFASWTVSQRSCLSVAGLCCELPPVCLTWSIEATHKTACHLHLEHGYQLGFFIHSLPSSHGRVPFFLSLFLFFFCSCSCVVWPCSSSCQGCSDRARYRAFFLFFFFKGAVHSHRVRSRLLEPGSEITGSWSQGRDDDPPPHTAPSNPPPIHSPPGLIRSWPSQSRRAPGVSGRLP